MVVIYLLTSSLIYSQLVCLQVTSNYVGKIGLFLLYVFSYLTDMSHASLSYAGNVFGIVCVCGTFIYIRTVCVSIYVNNIIFHLILFVCYHIPFCTALKQPNSSINCMELIQGSQICKGKLWYEIVSMKR